MNSSEMNVFERLLGFLERLGRVHLYYPMYIWSCCWCNHGYGKNAPTEDSVRPNQGVCEKHAVRRGAWVNEPSTLRSAYRRAKAEDFRKYQAGFRVARVLKC
jgi:formylglycine-generating enzyme required for sulfatase activity